MYEFANFLRRCSFCKLRTGAVDLLCEQCWESIVACTNKNNEISLNYRFLVRRLFVWDRANYGEVKKIIYALKYGHSDLVFDRLVTLFLAKLNRNFNDLIFIPAPGKKRQINHALLIAKSFSRLMGFPVADIFSDEKRRNLQKKLKRRDRFNKKLDVERKINFENKSIIFIDDVITTGATAKAVYSSLGQPRKFQVWVLAEKTLLKEGVFNQKIS